MRISVFILALTVYQIQAQEAFVIDSVSKSPIENVSFENRKEGVTSDYNGKVNISIFSYGDSIKIKHVSYNEKTIVKSDIKKTILLSPKVTILPTIELQGYVKLFNVRDNFIFLKTTSQEINSKTITEVLQKSGGLNIQKSQSGGGSPNFRGLEASRLLMVLDGVSLNNTIYRSGHMQSSSTINPFFIESFSVATGPSSISFGDGALGSVLIFNTILPKPNQDSRHYFYQKFESSSSAVLSNFKSLYSRHNVGFFTGFSIKSIGNLRMGKNRVHGYTNWGNEDVISIKNEQLYTQYNQVDFIHKTLVKLSGELKLLLNTQYSESSKINRFDKLNDVLDDGTAKYSSWYYGPQKRFMQIITLRSTKPALFYDSYSSFFSFQKVKESRHNKKQNQNFLSNRFENVDIYDGTLSFNKSFAKINTKYGFGMRKQLVTSTANNFQDDGISFYNTTRYPDGGTVVSDIFLYSKLQMALSKKIIFSSGIRLNYTSLNSTFIDTQTYRFPFSNIENTTKSVVNSILINYSISERLNINTSFYTGFRNPNLDDLGKVFSKNDNYVVIPNPDLNPEKSNNLEIGFNIKSKNNTALSVQYFNTVIKDAIGRELGSLNGQDSIIYDGEMMQIQMNKNIEKAYIQGFNIQLEYMPANNLIVTSKLNYVKGETGENLPLAHMPPFNGTIGFKYKIHEQKINFETIFSSWKRVEDYDLNGIDNLEEATNEGTPSWCIFNLDYTYTFDKNITIGVGVENIFDIHYKTFGSGISASGRNFTVSLYTNF